MRPLLKLCLALLALVWPALASAEGWRVVMSDDFSGTALDRTRWATRYIYNFEQQASLGAEVQQFSDNRNHILRNGVLSLVARPVAGLPKPYRFESGMIRSRQTFYYGYFEARVWLPSAKGSFPAFWLNPDYNADGETRWPPEIDAFEFVQNKNETPDMIHSAVRMSKNKPQGGDYLYRDPRFTEKHGYFRAAGPLDRGWQTIGVLWKPGRVTSYLNGEKLWTRSYRWVDKFGKPAPPAHVLLNFAVGGNWAGDGGFDDTAFPQEFRIDYVRVCQFTGGRDGMPTCGGSALTPSVAEGRYRAAGDMPKSFLTAAAVTPLANGRYSLRVALRGEPTGRDQFVNLVATDKRGNATMIARFRPSIPSTEWSGPLDMTGRFCPPRRLADGTYDLWLGVGSPGATGEWKNIPLTADDSFGIRTAHLRYRIGSVAIVGAGRQLTGPCKQESR